MNNRTYLFPGFKNWTFKTSDISCGLWTPKNGPGLTVTADTTVDEIVMHVEKILWLNFQMQGDAAKAGAKAMNAFDWQTMMSEAGTDVQHQTPSLPGWTLRISDARCGLWHISGACIQISVDTTMPEVAYLVRHILQDSLPPVEVDAQVDEVMRIDFKKLITNAWAPKAAPLLDGFTADNTALINEICADVRLLASMQKADSAAMVNEICDLVRKLS